jgi:arsenite methyltransferase
MAEMGKFEKFFINKRSTRSYRRMLDRMRASGQLRLTPASRVLELGAGNGALSVLIEERYHPAKVSITDYDPEQLVVAKKNLETLYKSIPPSVTFEREDATRLDYASGTFDLVMAHHMLHHLGSLEDVLRGLDEIARVLRPGGQLMYAEMFHKRQIMEHLVGRGFAIVYRERAHRIFSAADIVIAQSPAASS